MNALLRKQHDAAALSDLNSGAKGHGPKDADDFKASEMDAFEGGG